MERDKRGRFVKKAQTGTQLLPTLQLRNGNKYQLRQGISTTSTEPWLALAMQDPDKYELYLESYYEPVQEVPSNTQTGKSRVVGFDPKITTGTLGTSTGTQSGQSQVPVGGGIGLGRSIGSMNLGMLGLGLPKVEDVKLPNTVASVDPESLKVTIPQKESNFDISKITPPANYYDVKQIPSLNLPEIDLLRGINREQTLKNQTLLGSNGKFTTPKIKYTIQDGKFIDQYGKELNPATMDFNMYESDNSKFQAPSVDEVLSKARLERAKEELAAESDPSFGMNVSGNNTSSSGKNNLNWLNKAKLSDFLQLVRAGVGYAVNNKMAERALEAEKPFLQDVSENHRAVYGDYRSQIEGEKAAAKLRNLASKPLTSDGAIQQQMMMDAQLKGQQYVDQGRAKDEALIRQSREAAIQQEKENNQQRMAAAMQNKKSMLTTIANKAKIENTRDSANYSQILAPLLAGDEQRLRNNEVQKERYQSYYDDALASQDVWSNFRDNLTPEQVVMADKFKTGGLGAVEDYINGDTSKQEQFMQLQRIMNREIIRKQAASKGVYLNYPAAQTTQNFGIFSTSETPSFFYKKGGTVYKAKLNKRVKDNDRASKSIESSKKLAARLLEKALDSLYEYNDIEIVEKPVKKKRSYQAGGAIPFVNFTPVFASSEAQSPKEVSKSKEDKEDLTSKDVLSLLKEMDGLPTDINQIVTALKNFELMDSMDPLGMSSSSDIASRYISLISKIKIAKFNKDEYNSAFNQLKENGGLNEYAVTSEGLLIGSNKEGDFEYFTPEQVNSGEPRKNGYALLTNSNLLYLRANSSEAAFNHQLTTVAQNGIGMEVITKQVNDILQSLGKSKEGEEGMIQMGAKEQVKNGIKFLQKASKAVGDDGLTENMSIADYYQAGYMTEDQAQQAQLALQYIWSALPANAKSLLQVKGGGAAGAEAIIQSLVYSKTSTDTSFKANSKKMAKTGSSGGSGDSNVDGLKLSPVQMMQVGYTDHEKVTLQKGTKYAMTVNAQVLPITDVNKKLLGITTLDKVAESTFGGALDMNNVTMGSQLIDPQALQNVQVDSTNLYVMNLPIDKNSPDGTVKPDLSWMTKIEEIDKTIRDKHITDIDEINKLYVEAGLPVLMKDNGELNVQDYCKFGVLNGHALNSAFKDLDALDNSVIEVTDENDITNILNIINKGRGKEERVGFDEKSWWDSIFNTDHDSMYEGTIYIPIRTNAFTGMIGGGQYPDTEMAEEVEALIQQKERTRGYVDPGLLI